MRGREKWIIEEREACDDFLSCSLYHDYWDRSCLIKMENRQFQTYLIYNIRSIDTISDTSIDKSVTCIYFVVSDASKMQHDFSCMYRCLLII